MSPEPTPVSLRYEYLTEPLTLAGIVARKERLEAYRAPRLKWAARSMCTSGVLAVLLLLSLPFAIHFKDAAGVPFMTLMCAATLSAMPGVFLTLPLSLSSSNIWALEPVEFENEAELDWLLEHTPAAEALRAAVTLQPRPFTVGELNALRAAYQAHKAASAQPQANKTRASQ